MAIEYQKFSDIDLSNPFFNSLKEDYEEFPEWFKKKKDNHAYIHYSDDENQEIDGFLYLKDETEELHDVIPILPEKRRLKVGTFKINAHGTKLGERFLKKIFDIVIAKNYEAAYVTIFDKHKPLIDLFETYGFIKKAKKNTPNGTEGVYVRDMNFIPNKSLNFNYPLINTVNKKSYLLSLKPQFHSRLLPDSILKNENASIVTDISETNSIHKVYLAAMKGMNELVPGDVIVIYRTTDGQGAAEYRSVATSICVIEEYRNIHTFSNEIDFLNYTEKYSIFSKQELSYFWNSKKYPHIIKFSYNIALNKRIIRKDLISKVGLERSAYPGFLEITTNQLLKICQLGEINENLIIH